MRPIARKAVTALAVAGLSFSLIPQALADEGNEAEKEKIEANYQTITLCGQQPKVSPPDMPTTLPFDTSQGPKSLAVELSSGGDIITPERWTELIQSNMDDSEPWGKDESITLSFTIVEEGYEGSNRLYVQSRRVLIATQREVKVEVEAGETPTLPDAVELNFNTELNRNCTDNSPRGWKSTPIVWDELSAEQEALLDTPGEMFTVHGTAQIEGADGKLLSWPRSSSSKYPGYVFDVEATVEVTAPTVDKDSEENTTQTEDGDTQTDETPVADDENKPATKPSSNDRNALAKTGVNASVTLAVASLLASAGAGLLLFSRRRNN
ncbi:MAG: LPXTG cell wall anchor domain-containing protein [Actinomycetaceae bacterium]|nr:LPXTG cell wall anchor domain-containing protein [Actinomycetaceae bacterium]